MRRHAETPPAETPTDETPPAETPTSELLGEGEDDEEYIPEPLDLTDAKTRAEILDLASVGAAALGGMENDPQWGAHTPDITTCRTCLGWRWFDRLQDELRRLHPDEAERSEDGEVAAEYAESGTPGQ